MNKFIVFSLWLVVFLSLLILSYYIPYTTYHIPSIHAQNPCTSPSPGAIPFAEGLVTGESFGSTPQTDGPCLEGAQTNILLEQAKIRVDNYATLRSIFYEQSKATRGQTISSGNLPTLEGEKIYSSELDSNVTLTGGPGSSPSSSVAVIFIDGSLTISGNIIFRTNDPNSGIVFVVKDEINIDPSVTQIDGVLISSGKICTAYDGNPCNPASDYVISSPLTINGSLISLNPEEPIQFKRTLVDNSSEAAEKIYSQPKYLVILKGLFSKDLIVPF